MRGYVNIMQESLACIFMKGYGYILWCDRGVEEGFMLMLVVLRWCREAPWLERPELGQRPLVVNLSWVEKTACAGVIVVSVFFSSWRSRLPMRGYVNIMQESLACIFMKGYGYIS